MFNVVDDLIEVELKGSDDFLKIKETLTRIGIPSKKRKSLISVLSHPSQTRKILYSSF